MVDQASLIHYVQTNFLKEKEGVSLKPDDNLLLSGLLDSLDVIRLVKHLEEVNHIKIKPGEITLKNFKTVSAIAGFVERKVNAES